MLSSSCLSVLLPHFLPVCLSVCLICSSVVSQYSQKLVVDPGNVRQRSSVEYSCGNSPLPCCLRNSLNNFRCVCVRAPQFQSRRKRIWCAKLEQRSNPPATTQCCRQEGRGEGKGAGREAGREAGKRTGRGAGRGVGRGAVRGADRHCGIGDPKNSNQTVICFNSAC